MVKERKQDLGGADEEALEKHIDDMLDITVPDLPEEPTPVQPPTPKKVTVSFDDSSHEPTQPAPSDIASETELSTAIVNANQQLAGAVSTAPLVTAAKPKAKSKKVVVEEAESDPVIQPEAPSEQLLGAPELPDTAETETILDVPVDTTAQSDTGLPATDSVESSDDEIITSPLDDTIDSPETDTAVSAIVASESDELLAVQDDQVVENPGSIPKKPKRNFFVRWAKSSSARWATFLLVVAVLLTAGAYPDSRYYVLNKAGVTSSASITITDQSTLQPLKNVTVNLAGKKSITDDTGTAMFTQLPLGPTELTIEKRAFADYSKAMTIGWGSNPLDPVSLEPEGVQYVFTVTDVFSSKPIADAEASVGELSATADEKGEITLTLDDIESDAVTVKITAPGYRDGTVGLELSDKSDRKVVLTPDRQIPFISKRSGKFDLYKIDADGTNESQVLAGTGNESADITLLAHPTDTSVVLIASRDGAYTSDGRLLNNLIYVNLKDSSTKTVISSTQIRAIDWIGSRLVYVVLNDTAAADDPARYKLMSFDPASGDNRQLAATNYFNSVTALAGKVYYAPSSAFQNGINLGVFEVHADGSGKRALLDKESWNIIKTAYDTLTIAVEQDWFTYTAGADKPVKAPGQPADTISRVYVTSPDATRSMWLDSRDGKGVVVVYEIATKKETVLTSQSGLNGPLRWLNNSTVIFRLANGKETADYVMGIDGGVARKVVDVTNTAGVDRWSY